MGEAANHEFDVVIAGGGLVGASLAVALRGSGLTVAVVEPVEPAAESQPSFDDRQTALAPTSRRFFQNLGLWEAIEPGVAAIQQIHVSDRGHGGFTRLNAAEEGLPALGHVAPNRVLGAALRPAMEAAATVFCPAEIIDTQLVYGAGDDEASTAGPSGASGVSSAVSDAQPVGRKIRLRSARTPGAADSESDYSDAAGEQILNARLLVVADGMRSATREALGVTTRDRDYGQSAIIANLRTEKSHRGVAYERFTPNGPLALLPAGDDAVSLVWTLPHDEARAVANDWSEEDFLARLQDEFGWRLGRLEAVGQRFVYPLIAVTAEQFATDRAVILGNAAHALHPVAGQGLNLALRDVAALAEALGGGISSAEVSAGQPEAASSDQSVVTSGAAGARGAHDPGSPALLEAYARARQSDYRRTFTFTDGLVRLFSNEFLPIVAARNIGLTLLDLFPPARRLLLKQATGAAGYVPALCRE